MHTCTLYLTQLVLYSPNFEISYPYTKEHHASPNPMRSLVYVEEISTLSEYTKCIHAVANSLNLYYTEPMLGSFASMQNKSITCTQSLLKLKTQLRFCPVS